MALKLVQTYGRYLGRTRGKDRWDWEVRLVSDVNELELELVEKVVYTLHSSYDNPVREKTTRDNGFAVWAQSTGVFEVKATIYQSAGCPFHLKLQLDLFYPTHDESVVYD